MVKNKFFEYFILAMIVLSSVQLALENPLNNPEGKLVDILFVLDIILTIIFSLEAAFKIVAFGFVFNGKDSYIRNYWNIMDFIVVLFSVSTSHRHF